MLPLQANGCPGLDEPARPFGARFVGLSLEALASTLHDNIVAWEFCKRDSVARVVWWEILRSSVGHGLSNGAGVSHHHALHST